MYAAINLRKKGVQSWQLGAIITDIADKIHYIRQNTLFKNLSDEQITPLAQKAVVKHLPAHALFITQDDFSSVVYFITKGSARIFRLSSDGEELNIGLCGPGDIIGEMALLSGHARSANVQSIQELEVLEVNGNDFVDSLKQQPEIAINLLRVFSTRLQNNNIYMEEILSKNLSDRTYTILQSLVKYFPNNDILLSQEELATIVGATRSRVTEVLNTLAIEGKISLSHRKIHLN